MTDLYTVTVFSILLLHQAYFMYLETTLLPAEYERYIVISLLECAQLLFYNYLRSLSDYVLVFIKGVYYQPTVLTCK